MKVTASYCDFNNPNVKSHSAQFELRVPGNGAEQLEELDSCEAHLRQILIDLFRKDIRTIKVTRIDGVELPSISGQKGVGVWACEECGKEYQSTSGLRMHKIRESHGTVKHRNK